MPGDESSDLAAALRSLRAESGLTAATVARRAGMSTAKLSKLENARTLPTVTDVERVLTALQTPRSVRQELMVLAQAAVTEQRAWRVYQQLGFHKKQVEIAAVEAQSSQVRVFQPAMVPGLLQTAEYVRSIFDGRHDLSPEERDRTVNSRLRRQSVLYDGSKKFSFLVCETALRWRTVTEAAMANQVDRIISLSKMPNITVDVIPFDGLKPDFPMAAFCVFDNRLVTIETFHAELSTRDPKDVELHLNVFRDMSGVALRESDARIFLTEVAAEMRRAGN